MSSVSTRTHAAMAAALTFLSASEAAGPTSAVWRGGGAGSGGPRVTQNRWGDPEAGRGMGVDTSCRSRRQARFNSSSTSLVGPTATLPITTVPLRTPAFFGDVDISEGRASGELKVSLH